MIMTAINYVHNGYHKLMPEADCMLADRGHTNKADNHSHNNRCDNNDGAKSEAKSETNELGWYLGRKLLAVV
ncbi:hypothetical protein [Ferrimonas senticii]|uniref:hypothetical protein n=1 Tax=Ferrimonas senticii TaxID=394566 RepID=UPI000408B6D0|nr:hypothetical protein [Ferrimonas senticii]